jgi:uncharacterized membrane protein YdbT with pleckstrin-like domain
MLQLNQNEIIIKAGKVHWWAYSGFMVTALFGLILLAISNWLGVMVFFFATLIGIHELVTYSNNEFIITNERIFATTGVFNTQSIEILISKVEGVTINQSLIGSILNFGTIKINGVGGTKEPIALIKSPYEFRKILNDSIKKSSDVSTKNLNNQTEKEN